MFHFTLDSLDHCHLAPCHFVFNFRNLAHSRSVPSSLCYVPFDVAFSYYIKFAAIICTYSVNVTITQAHCAVITRVYAVLYSESNCQCCQHSCYLTVSPYFFCDNQIRLYVKICNLPIITYGITFRSFVNKELFLSFHVCLVFQIFNISFASFTHPHSCLHSIPQIVICCDCI
jgi:hypothetical protein